MMKMFNTAKVTLDYKEFQSLIEKNEELEEQNKKLSKMFDEAMNDLESNKYIMALNDIEHRLQKATDANRLAGKQKHIDEALDIYCKVFDIPNREELR